MALTIPKFIRTAFAVIGIKSDIPDISDNVTGRAGYNKGFPEINMQPLEAGGIAPSGMDFNGILFDVTAAIQYLQTGTNFPFNQDFATSIGGYPRGSIVSDPSQGEILWVNTTPNNLQPPSASTGWTQINISQATDTIRGVARIATQPEIDIGSGDNTIVTPQRMRLGVSYLFARGGFVTFPTWLGGLIIQWGAVEVDPRSSVTFSYPISFTSECYGVQVTTGIPGGPESMNSGIVSRTQFSLENTANAVRACWWFAYGK